MPRGLKRYQQSGHIHLITFSCYGRVPYLAVPQSRDIFEQVLEQSRLKHSFEIFAYVVMPEHVHLLLSEPPETELATVLKVLKQETSRRLKEDRDHFWMPRYHDFNVFTTGRVNQKIDYIHHNPVKRGLVEKPEDWPWSSFRHYATGNEGSVNIESYWTFTRSEQTAV